MEIILGSKNQGKIRELNAIATDLAGDLKFCALPDFVPDVAETGDTYEANAMLKAVAQAQILGRPVLAEDSGLAVKALNGLPGVWSARFCNAEFDFTSGTLLREEPEHEKIRGQARDDLNNQLLLNLMRMCEDRQASLKVCFVLALPNGEIAYKHTTDYPATIAHSLRGDQGFAYDKLIEGNNIGGRTLAEISFEEKVNRGPRRENMTLLQKACENFALDAFGFPDQSQAWRDVADPYFARGPHTVRSSLLNRISVQEIVQQLQKIAASEAAIKVHPLGFVQIPLSSGKHRHDEGLRLNIWPEGYRLQDGNDIHAHTFSMVSRVLVGAINNYEFDWLEDPKGSTVVGEITHEGHKHFLRDTGRRGYFKQAPAQENHTGQEYYVKRGRYHTTSLPGTFTVTLIDRYEIDPDAPNLVIATKGLAEPVIYDKRPLDQQQARAMLTQAIHALQEL